MAPTAISPYQEADIRGLDSKLKGKKEVKTSGQHPPVVQYLRTYEDFPKHIDGRTVWRTEDYKDKPERWTHRFTQEEITELSTAADKFNESGIPRTSISKVLSHPIEK